MPSICETIQRAITFLHAIQRPEGGWVGSWGICVTYATMFALESLSLVGETYETSQSARRACDFLVSKQRETAGGVRAIRYAITLLLWLDQISGVDMRSLRVDRAREHPGSANILGSNGTRVRGVSTYRADCKGCGVGHVSPTPSS